MTKQTKKTLSFFAVFALLFCALFLSPILAGETSAAAAATASAVLPVSAELADFTENLSDLNDFAKDYIANHADSQLKNAQKKGLLTLSPDIWLTFAYIRYTNPSYRTDDWRAVGGSLETSPIRLMGVSFKAAPGGESFLDFVAERAPRLSSYFSDPQNRVIDGVDIPHMSVLLTSLIYNTCNYTLTGLASSLVMNERQYEDLSGWAGDLQTLLIDLAEAYPNESRETYAALTRDALTDVYPSSYGSEDLLANADAVNLYHALKSGGDFRDTVTEYYSVGVGTRFSTFVSHEKLSTAYAKQYTVLTYRTSTVWHIYSGTLISIPAELSDGVAEGFIAYLKELAPDADFNAPPYDRNTFFDRIADPTLYVPVAIAGLAVIFLTLAGTTIYKIAKRIKRRRAFRRGR